ncbi:MAG: lactate racemase domain-containing protein [Planctomycetota bacterium]|nr:lactate racemase domain-containing protein [Planctomycetota bacterium]
MAVELKYGDSGTLQIDVPANSVLVDFSTPRGVPLDDPAAAVAAAVSAPLEFPRLQDATVPGDRVVLAVDRGVPQMPAVVAGVIHALVEGSARPSDLEVVLAVGADESHQDPLAALPESLRNAITVSHHDPNDRESLSYLAASKEGNPIYFNRTLGNADVVLPISTLRLDQALGYAGVHGGLYPTFSDDATQKRYRAPSSSDWSALRRRRCEEAEEAAWALGVQFTIQVAPGAGNTLLHVLAGDSQAVAKRGQELCTAAWFHQPAQRANLVVAAIEGGADQQTWENFGRALFAASQAVNDGGAIVICSSLRCRPGPALQRLMGMRDYDSLLHELRRERSVDATPAALLAEALERVQVFLLSDLDEASVEDLGVGHVGSTEQLERLSRQFDSCILLGNAQHAFLATPAE